jgi:hypothetical protein
MILERVFEIMKERWLIINLGLLLWPIHYPWNNFDMKFTIQAKRVMPKNTKHLLGQFQHEMSHVASYQRNFSFYKMCLTMGLLYSTAHPTFRQHIMFEENALMLCDNIRWAKGLLNDQYERNPKKKIVINYIPYPTPT